MLPIPSYRLIAGIGLASITFVIVVYYRSKKVKTLDDKSEKTKSTLAAPLLLRAPTCDRTVSFVDPTSDWTSVGFDEPLVIVMVGLPARGKSYICKMLIRYLRWNGLDCDLFNVGSYRRKMGLASMDSTFFSGDNSDANRVREELAMAVQEHMYSWLKASLKERRIAIFDATNTTIKRRMALSSRARAEGVSLMYIESICDDPQVLAQNYALKLNNDDYKGMDHSAALKDFTDRVTAYELVYEVITLVNRTLSVFKLSRNDFFL